MTKKNSDKTNSLEVMKTEYRTKVASMNYEDAVKHLDNILSNLQIESIPINELQKNYIYGNVLLEHCQNLLANLEQEIIEFDL